MVWWYGSWDDAVPKQYTVKISKGTSKGRVLLTHEGSWALEFAPHPVVCQNSDLFISRHPATSVFFVGILACRSLRCMSSKLGSLMAPSGICLVSFAVVGQSNNQMNHTAIFKFCAECSQWHELPGLRWGMDNKSQNYFHCILMWLPGLSKWESAPCFRGNF